MSEYISRYNRRGKSIVNDIYFGVENGTIGLIATIKSDGRRLDHYAHEYYGNGLNWWVIAAASGIRWGMGIGDGDGNKAEDEKTVLFIPNMSDVLALKER